MQGCQKARRVIVFIQEPERVMPCAQYPLTSRSIPQLMIVALSIPMHTTAKTVAIITFPPFELDRQC